MKGKLTYEEYVRAIADVLSGDPDRMAEGNKQLFDAATDERGEHHPSLALVDAEHLLVPVGSKGT